MLILTRGVHETIVVNGETYLTIMRIGEGQVRIAIEAPPEVRVDRLEVHQARQRGISPRRER